MNRTRIILSTLAFLPATATGAFAAETAKVYSSSILALAFVGFLALVVVIQLVPAIMTLVGTLTALAKNREKSGMAKVNSRN